MIRALMCPNCGAPFKGCGQLPDGRLYFMCAHCETPSIDEGNTGLLNDLKDAEANGTSICVGPYVVYGKACISGTSAKAIILREEPDHSCHVRNLTVTGTAAVARIVLAKSATIEVSGTSASTVYE